MTQVHGYHFTAKPLPLDRGDIVSLINGGMAQRGFSWMEFERWPRDLAEEVAELALLDNGYCIDAPAGIPAGACYGVPCIDEFAASVQVEVKRP